MGLELATAFVRVRIDRAQLRAEISAARRMIIQGLSGIRVPIRLDIQGLGGRGAGSTNVFGNVFGNTFNRQLNAQFNSQLNQLLAQFNTQLNTQFNTRNFNRNILSFRQNNITKNGGAWGSRLGGWGQFAQGVGFQVAPTMTAAGYFGGPGALAGAGTGMAVMGAAGLASKGMETFAEFEDAFHRVKIVQREAGATEEAIAKLEKQARELGRSTIFSATEAAQAMTILTQKGFDALEVYRQMPNVLNLAAAGQIEFAEAADIVASVQKQYGMTADKTNDIVDILAKASLSSAANVQDLGIALSYVGPIAKLSGKNLQETVAALMLLTDAGMEASRAGTGLTRILTKMSDSKKIEMFEAIGVAVRDGSGRLRPLADIVDDTSRALAGLSATERVDFAIKVFGERGGPAFASLLEQSADKLRENMELLEGFGGTAQRIGESRMDTMTARLETMRDAARDVGIAFGELFSDDTKQGIDGITESLTLLSTALESIKSIKGQTGVFNVLLPPMREYVNLLRAADIGLKAFNETALPRLLNVMLEQFGMEPIRVPRTPTTKSDFKKKGAGEAGGRKSDFKRKGAADPFGDEIEGDTKVSATRAERGFQPSLMGIQELQRSIQVGVLRKEDKPLQEIASNTKETADGVAGLVDEVHKFNGFQGLA
jgi:TP901 family phage tail tape measure protein